MSPNRKICHKLGGFMNRVANILTGLSLAVLFVAVSAHAQNAGQKMLAKVPFEFTVGRTPFPAGQYEFVRTGAYIFQVRAADGRTRLAAASAPLQQNRVPEKSRLTFSAVNGRHVLVQIWDGNAYSGSEFPNRTPAVEVAKPATIPGNLTNNR
jgi:hypothetical protein